MTAPGLAVAAALATVMTLEAVSDGASVPAAASETGSVRVSEACPAQASLKGTWVVVTEPQQAVLVSEQLPLLMVLLRVLVLSLLL